MIHSSQCDYNAEHELLWPDTPCDCKCHLTGDLYPGTTSIEEPEEDDYVSYDGGTSWFQNGRMILTPDPEGGTNAAKRLRQHADAHEFWPTAWLVSDHGNSHPFKYHI